MAIKSVLRQNSGRRHPEVKTMELEVPTAIGGNLLSYRTRSVIQPLRGWNCLPRIPDGLGGDVRKSRDDADLWTARLSPRMWALARADGNHLRLLAVASHDQLLPYLTPDGQRAA
jgi:hypothetical protein